MVEVAASAWLAVVLPWCQPLLVGVVVVVVASCPRAARVLGVVVVVVASSWVLAPWSEVLLGAALCGATAAAAGGGGGRPRYAVARASGQRG